MIAVKELEPGDMVPSCLCCDGQALYQVVLGKSGSLNRIFLCRPCLRELSSRGTFISQLRGSSVGVHFDNAAATYEEHNSGTFVSEESSCDS